MGVGDFGVDPATKTAYTYSSPEITGEVDYQSLQTYNATLGATAHSVGFQLNLILVFTAGGVQYSYWVQNVASIDTQTYRLSFIDNIWNMSSKNANIYTSTVSGNGVVANSGGTGFYYDVAANGLPGNNIVDAPPNAYIYMDITSGTIGGLPAVQFSYVDPGTSGKLIHYDTPVFNFASGLTADYGFVVDGTTLNPLGLFYDSEFIMGGPGGGSQTQDVSSNMKFFMHYWNGNNFDNAPSTYNFGCNTAEGVTNTESIGVFDGNGSLFNYVLNGNTAPDNVPATSYAESNVGTLNLSAPTVTGKSYGSLFINQTKFGWTFINAYANVVLGPGTYAVSASVNGGTPTSLGTCTILAGQVLRISMSSGCGGGGGPSISAFTASPNPVAVNSATTFTVTASGGTTPYTYAYTGLPAGCSTSNTATLSCTPTATGNFTITVTVTDAGSKTATKSMNLTVSSSGGFSVTTFTASVNPVIVNKATTLTVTATGGSTPYSYSYAGLPAGCTSSSTASLSCTPTATGSFLITVTVTDATGKTATKTLTLTVSAANSGGGGGGQGSTILGLDTTTFLLLVVLIAVVAIGVAALFIISRRGGAPPQIQPASSASYWQGPAAAQPNPQGYAPTPAPAPQAPAPPQVAPAAFCSKCGSPVEADFAFCRNCGTPITA